MTDPLLLSYAEQTWGQIDQPPPAKPVPVLLAVTLPLNLKADSWHRTTVRRLSKAVLEQRLSLIAWHQQTHINRQAA